MESYEALEKMIDKYADYEEYREFCVDETYRRNEDRTDLFYDEYNCGYTAFDTLVSDYTGTEESMYDFVCSIGKSCTYHRYMQLYGE